MRVVSPGRRTIAHHAFGSRVFTASAIVASSVPFVEHFTNSPANAMGRPTAVTVVETLLVAFSPAVTCVNTEN